MPTSSCVRKARQPLNCPKVPARAEEELGALRFVSTSGLRPHGVREAESGPQQRLCFALAGVGALELYVRRGGGLQCL